MLELRLLRKIASQKLIGTKFLVPKILMSVLFRLERVFLNKIRRTKFAAKIWISLIETSPTNDSPLVLGWKFVNSNYQLLWFEGDLLPSSLDITCACEKHDGKYCMLLLLFFNCFFFWHDICKNSCLNDYRNQYVFFKWSLMLFRNYSGQWRIWQNVHWGRWWQIGHNWWR